MYAPTVCYEVYGFGCAANINDFGAVLDVDEFADFFAAAFVQIGGFLA
jgi:hypothetical protein